jgi:hypothetical protein
MAETEAEKNHIAELYGQIDFTAYADLDISEIETKVDEAQSKIEELTKKEFEINMSWDNID